MKPIAKSMTKSEAHSNVDFRFYSCSWKEMDRPWNRTITLIISGFWRSPKAITRLLRHDQSVPRGSDGAIHYSDTHRRVQEEEVRRCFALVTWRLDINSGKRRRSEEKMSKYCVNPNSSSQSLYLSRGIQGQPGDNAVDPTLQDSVLITERIHRVHPPRREREWVEFHNNDKWMNYRRKKPQERKTSSILHYNEPDARWIMAWKKLHAIWRIQGSRHTRILGNAFKKQYCWCSLKLAQERGPAILPDTVTCSRSPQHTACILHWESGMCENSGWALPEGSLNSESATCRVEIELAIWSTRSTKPRRKIILGTIQRSEKLRWNL